MMLWLTCLGIAYTTSVSRWETELTEFDVLGAALPIGVLMDMALDGSDLIEPSDQEGLTDDNRDASLPAESAVQDLLQREATDHSMRSPIQVEDGRRDIGVHDAIEAPHFSTPHADTSDMADVPKELTPEEKEVMQFISYSVAASSFSDYIMALESAKPEIYERSKQYIANKYRFKNGIAIYPVRVERGTPDRARYIVSFHKIVQDMAHHYKQYFTDVEECRAFVHIIKQIRALNNAVKTPDVPLIERLIGDYVEGIHHLVYLSTRRTVNPYSDISDLHAAIDGLVDVTPVIYKEYINAALSGTRHRLGLPVVAGRTDPRVEAFVVALERYRRHRVPLIPFSKIPGLVEALDKMVELSSARESFVVSIQAPGALQSSLSILLTAKRLFLDVFQAVDDLVKLKRKMDKEVATFREVMRYMVLLTDNDFQDHMKYIDAKLLERVGIKHNLDDTGRLVQRIHLFTRYFFKANVVKEELFEGRLDLQLAFDNVKREAENMQSAIYAFRRSPSKSLVGPIRDATTSYLMALKRFIRGWATPNMVDFAVVIDDKVDSDIKLSKRRRVEGLGAYLDCFLTEPFKEPFDLAPHPSNEGVAPLLNGEELADLARSVPE